MSDGNTFDNSGKVALWDSKSDNARAPVLKGNLYAHRDIAAGEKVEVALWANEGYVEGGNKPRLRGKVSDVRIAGNGPREESPQPAPATEQGEIDDFAEGVPF